MKKVFFAVAVFAALTACNKEVSPVPVPENGQLKELAVASVSATTTKGYVEGEDFLDTAYDKLHEDGENPTEARKMLLSAYVEPTTGEAGNYFTGEIFAKGDDELYHHDPKIYWPLASKLSFLAVSSTEEFSGTAIKWNADNVSKQVILDVSKKYLQDDILFAGAFQAEKANSSDKGTVPMVFNHAQAWIEFQLQVADESMEDILTIKDIKLENVYSRGELTITGPASTSESATASWNFNKEAASDLVMDDTYDVTGNFLTKDVSYMDMLIPEQGQTSILITYTLNGGEELQYRYNLDTATWQMGKKYIYKIKFSLYEITIDPSVVPFADGDVSNFNPTELS